jgi:hypothetical protein
VAPSTAQQASCGAKPEADTLDYQLDGDQDVSLRSATLVTKIERVVVACPTGFKRAPADGPATNQVTNQRVESGDRQIDSQVTASPKSLGRERGERVT